MKRFINIILFLYLFFLLGSMAYSHSGRLDANGGHFNRKTGEYHYHRKNITTQSHQQNKLTEKKRGKSDNVKNNKHKRTRKKSN